MPCQSLHALPNFNILNISEYRCLNQIMHFMFQIAYQIKAKVAFKDINKHKSCYVVSQLLSLIDKLCLLGIYLYNIVS